MWRNRKFWLVLALVAMLALALAACGGQATEAPATEAPATEEAQPTEAPQATEEAQPTEEPMPAHTGAWVDEVTFITETDSQAAVKRLQEGLIDVYAFTIGNPELYKAAKEDPNVKVVEFFGVYNELTINPYGVEDPEGAVTERDGTKVKPEFDNGLMNPFANPKVREALNWLVDRNYIAQEIMGGLATPKYLPITSAFPDYARYIDTVREIEAKYAYNFEKAKEVISAEMEAMGAEMNDEGIWTYNGEPVTIIILIRVEDERKEIGDYLANQLEELGFKVERRYGTFSDLGAYWIRGNPADGEWHIYTGGWITTAVSRDQGGNFEFFYTPRGLGIALWQAYRNSADFDTAAERLANNDFADMAERDELFRTALRLANEEAVRIWLVDQKSFSVVRSDIHVAYDLAGGISGAVLWPYTLRKGDAPGGSVTWVNADILSDVWNPVGGSDAIYDMQAIRATGDWGAVSDPYTGLAWPQRIERAEVVATTGTPITKTLDWVSLEFADEIQVPDDAWVDWDAANQQWITKTELNQMIADAQAKVDAAKAKAAELAGAVDTAALNADAVKQFLTDLAAAYGLDVDVAAAFEGEDAQAALDEKVKAIQEAEDPAAALADYGVEFLAAQDAYTFALAEREPITTARVKSVVYYPEDLYEKVTWHDGSPFDVADIIMYLIMTFDRGKEASAIFDESYQPDFESFLSVFRGVRIVSEQPLVIEYYSDSFQLDAELNVSTLWPQYGYGEGAWHTIALGVLAEENQELAFTADKADALEIEWMNYVAGPSLEILAKYLDQAMADNYIPYANVLGAYITADEAKARWENLKAWYDAKGHFWVGTGPFYLDSVFPLEKTVVLKRYEAYPDPADKWLGFGEPKLATVTIEGPARVSAGAGEATFDVYVTFHDEPYPADEISGVKFLLFNSQGAVVTTGEASMVEDGHYQIVLDADTLGQLGVGANRLEVAVTSKLVSIPALESIEFLSIP